MVDLSVIIVNWKSAAYLDRCLQSIVDKTGGITYEIIVVDNASYDGSEAVARRYGAAVRFVQSNENVGFAKANNLGFRHSNGRILLFLNPDTEVARDSLARMHHRLLRLSDAGALGCRILNPDGTVQTSCIQAFPTIANQFFDADWLRRLTPRSRLWGMAPLFDPAVGAAEVEAISGACLMVHRAVFEQVGLFSTEYFMFAEDIDLCFKVRQAGFKNYYSGEATIVHYGGGSTRQAGRSLSSAVLVRESIRRFLKKFRGEAYSRAFVGSVATSSLARLALLIVARLASRIGILSYARVADSWNKWQRIFRWSIGMEAWAKNT
jgi:GT2 family glycosyltransferase